MQQPDPSMKLRFWPCKIDESYWMHALLYIKAFISPEERKSKITNHFPLSHSLAINWDLRKIELSSAKPKPGAGNRAKKNRLSILNSRFVPAVPRYCFDFHFYQGNETICTTWARSWRSSIWYEIEKVMSNSEEWKINGGLATLESCSIFSSTSFYPSALAL